MIPEIKDRKSIEWSALSTLFGAYLNQDFPEDYGDPWSAVATYRSENPDSELTAATAAARRLARDADDDDEARRAVERLSLGYYPPADGYTYRGWLTELADFLESTEPIDPSMIKQPERISPIQPGHITGFSSFYDRDAAEQAVGENIHHNRDAIERWLRDPPVRHQKFEFRHDRAVGRLGSPGDTPIPDVVDVSGSRVILRPHAEMPEGYLIYVAFPTRASADHEHGMPELANFFGSYLNQDLYADHGGPQAAVEALRGEATRQYVVRVAEQAQQLLERTPDDSGLWEVMVDMGIGYIPSADGWADRDWLEQLVRDLRV